MLLKEKRCQGHDIQSTFSFWIELINKTLGPLLNPVSINVSVPSIRALLSEVKNEVNYEGSEDATVAFQLTAEKHLKSGGGRVGSHTKCPKYHKEAKYPSE